MSELLGRRAAFHRMDEGTRQDWDIITAHLVAHAENTVAGRALEQMACLEGDHGGFAVDRLTHSLQTAYLAEQDGRDEEYVVCALLHDIGDVLAPLNHPDVAAGILKPYVSEANHWMVQNHGTVQGYYFWHHIGLDRNARDALRDSPFYEQTEQFCARYDQLAFDPDGTTPPLAHYEDAVRNVLRVGRRVG